MRVQDGACAAAAGDRHVQQRLGRRPRRRLPDRHPVGAYDQHVRGPDRALRDRARRDGQSQRRSAGHRTEVAARAQHPTPAVKVAPNLFEDPCNGGQRQAHLGRAIIAQAGDREVSGRYNNGRVSRIGLP